MGVYWNRSRRGVHGGECHFGRLDGIAVREAEAQAVDLVEVEGVGVEDADVHLPFLQVVGFDECYAGREGLVNLGFVSQYMPIS